MRTAAAWALFVGTAASTGCEESLLALVREGDIEYRLRDLVIAESFPVQIGVTVEIENVGSATQTVVFPDGCVVLMRAYADGQEPVWDMGEDHACTEALVEVELEPGETRDFQTGLVSAHEILDDDLPDGAYRITAYLRPGETIELEAGSVDLAIPRQPTH